jgi:polysaccharide export outer membrane protein
MLNIPQLKNLLLISASILILSSCSATKARREKTLFNSPSDYVTDTIKHVYVVNDQGMGDVYYRIKVNDLIAIKNKQNKEFLANTATTTASIVETTNVVTFPVENDGSVNLPAVGKVVLAGLTRKEATEKLQQILEKNQLSKPIIEVTIVNVKVTLLGEFNTQGNFLLERDNTSLVEIIGQAGGINTLTADPKTLKIIRGDRSKPEIIYVNLNDINSLASKKLILQNNDIIVLQSTKNIALTQKLQNFNNVMQPLLVIINLGVIIFSFTR